MDIKVKLNGVDVTAKVDRLGEHGGPPLGIHQNITHRISTCELSLVAPSAAPATWQTLVISNTGESENYFAGYVTAFRTTTLGISLLYALRGQDYSVLLDSVIANKVYTSSTGKTIVQDLFSTYLSEITTADFVDDDLVTITRIVFSRVTLRQALEEVSQAVGWDWFVDGDKKLHWFSPTAPNMAPFGLSDTPDESTTYGFQMLDYGKDAIQPINDILVEGTRKLSGDTTWELGSDGVTLYVGLPYRLLPPDGETEIDVWTNSGNDGVPVWDVNTVGIDGQDTGKDVYYNRKDRLLRFTVAPLALNLAVKVTGQFELMVASRQYDYDSYDTYGRWFRAVYTDDRIDSVEQARLKAKAIARQHSTDQEYGTLLCWEDGLAVGDTLWVKDDLRGLAGFFLIRKIDWRWVGATLVEYAVGFAGINPSSYELSFNDFLVYLDRASQKHSAVVDQEEVPYEYIDNPEPLSLTEVFQLQAEGTEQLFAASASPAKDWYGGRRFVRRADGALYGLLGRGSASVLQLWERPYNGSWALENDVVAYHVDITTYSQAALAMDASGTLHMVWAASVGGVYSIVYHRYDTEGDAYIGTEEIVGTLGSGSPQYPDIALLSDGTPCVVWRDADGVVQFRHRTAGGSWETAEAVGTGPGAEPQYEPRIAIDPDDNPHVVWWGDGWGTFVTKTQCCYRKRTAGSWDGSVTLLSDVDFNQYGVAICADLSDGIHVLYRGLGWGVNTGNYNVCYRRWSAGWDANVVLQDTAVNAWHVQIACDQQDTIYAIWQEGPYNAVGVKVQYVIRNGGWGAVQDYTNPSGWKTHYPSPLCAMWPVVQGKNICFPKTGMSFLFIDGIYRPARWSKDLAWE